MQNGEVLGFSYLQEYIFHGCIFFLLHIVHPMCREEEHIFYERCISILDHTVDCNLQEYIFHGCIFFLRHIVHPMCREEEHIFYVHCISILDHTVDCIVRRHSSQL